MIRFFALLFPWLLFFGCTRDSSVPVSDAYGHAAVQVVIVDGAGETDPVVTAASMVKLPGYYDLSAFDSILVSFRAERLEQRVPSDQVLVKIGPACYRQDSVSGLARDIAVRFYRSDLSKPNFCAISFLAGNPEASLVLKRIKVVGWVTQ